MGDQLTEEQKEEYRETFRILTGNEGKLTPEGLGAILRQTGREATAQELEEMIKEGDSKKNGLVSFEEFLEIMTRKMSHNDIDEMLQEAFAFYDRDGDGFIVKEELFQALQEFNTGVSEEEVEAMIKEADFDNENKISFDKFHRLITQK